MKASISQLQQLLITFNKETGKPEISQNINNIREAYERLNNFIGDKILTATYAFSDALRDLNDPDNLAELEHSVSNIGLLLEDAGGIASKVVSAIEDVAKRAIDGYDALPEWMRDVGLVGAVVLGKKGWLALGATSALIDRGKDFAKGISLFVETGKMSI